MYAPVRGGNRGGWDQFKWDDVRYMTYKDRECYLGASERLGYLDKGGKWRKRDWWVGQQENLADSSNDDAQQKLKMEREQIKREEEAMIRQRLGLDSYKDPKVLLQELREGSEASQQMLNRLTEYEMKELTAKEGTLPHQVEQAFEMQQNEKDTADRVGGLGTKTSINAAKSQYSKSQRSSNVNKLEGEGVEDLKYMDQRKKLVMINYLREKIEQQKKEKKEKKRKAKEEKRKKKEERKKQKKDCKEKRHRSPSRSERDRKRKRERSRSRERRHMSSRSQDKNRRVNDYHRRNEETRHRSRDERHNKIHKEKRQERSQSEGSSDNNSSSSFLSD